MPDGASQPRVDQLTKKIGAVVKETPGVEGWVTIGGFSVLDSANRSNMASIFVIYQDWSKRPDMPQEEIIAHLDRALSTIQEARIAVLIPPSIPGLGQAGGFQMMVEDRGALGLGELQKVDPSNWLARRTRNRAWTGSFRPSAPTVRSFSSISTAPRRSRSGCP